MLKRSIYLLFFLTISIAQSYACTNILVTPGASKDGSAMIVYLCDGEFIQHLQKYPAADHAPGSWRTVEDGKIKEIAHTYGRVGFQMNEKQLAIGETTFTGREELWNHKCFMKYWDLMEIALERASSAREAIQVITSLVEEYGYGSEGESFSIADTKEAWILEMIGNGPDKKGASWVAIRVPDGMISAHANHSRISEFPLNDPENCLYSKNVISFAVENGFYDPKSGEPFRFNEAYNPPTPAILRYCDSRVWSIFNRAAPSLNLSIDYSRGIRTATPYPLCIKPDQKLDVQDIISLIRDHYEGTAIDMTKGLEAGPYGTPDRNRPISFDVDGEKYSFERPISTVNTAFSFISQSRSWLPDEVGGVMWYSPDDTYSNCYIPFYPCIKTIPKAYSIGSLNNFSMESAWWVFNFVSNYMNLKYCYMIKDVQKVQKELETNIFARQDSIEQLALKTFKKSNEAGTDLLQSYCNETANHVLSEWKNLGEFLIVKYIDGYINDKKRSGQSVGYPQEWYEKSVKDKPALRLPQWEEKKKESNEPKSY